MLDDYVLFFLLVKKINTSCFLEIILLLVVFVNISLIISFSCVFCKADELFTEYESKLFSNT